MEPHTTVAPMHKQDKSTGWIWEKEETLLEQEFILVRFTIRCPTSGQQLGLERLNKPLSGDLNKACFWLHEDDAPRAPYMSEMPEGVFAKLRDFRPFPPQRGCLSKPSSRSGPLPLLKDNDEDTKGKSVLLLGGATVRVREPETPSR